VGASAAAAAAGGLISLAAVAFFGRTRGLARAVGWLRAAGVGGGGGGGAGGGGGGGAPAEADEAPPADAAAVVVMASAPARASPGKVAAADTRAALRSPVRPALADGLGERRFGASP